MALALLNNEVAQDTVDVENVVVSGQLADAVRRMIGYCQRGHLDASFIAKGLVIDTLEDIGAQMREFFPDYTGVRHMVAEVEDKAKAVAQSSGQRYQHISFLYVDSPSKLPKPDDAGKQHSITVYGENMSNVGSDASVMAAAYRPPSGGGVAGGGANLLDHLRIANKIVFVLMFTVLDADDVRILDLISQPEVAAAFAGSPEALSALRDAMLAGGDVGALAQSVLQNVVAVHGLRVAAQSNPVPQKMQAIETALVQKVASITIDLPVISAKLPSAVSEMVTKQVSQVKAEMTARHVARVVAQLDNGFKTGVLKADIAPLAAVLKSVNGVMREALTGGTTVAAVVAAVITGAATPAQSLAVKQMGDVLGRTATLPSIETSMPEMRAALITPVTQTAALQKIEPQVVAEQLKELSVKTNNPVLQEVVTRLESVAALPAVLRPMQLQAVADNLQAVSQSANLPAAVKAELAVIVPQAEVMAVQARMPDMGVAANQALPTAVAKAVDGLQALANSSQDKTLVAAVVAINKAAPEQRAKVMEAVEQNLAAVAMMKSTSPALSEAISAILPDIKRARVEADSRAPVPVGEGSVIDALSEGKTKFVSPEAKGQEKSVSDILREQQKKNDKPEADKEPTKNKSDVSCGLQCQTGGPCPVFNGASCGASAMAAMLNEVNEAVKSAPKPSMA